MTRYERITTPIEKAMDKTESLVFHSRDLCLGEPITKADERESFAEILNKTRETPQEEDLGDKCIPWVVLAVLYVICRAFYFVFIYEHQLP